MSNTAQQISKKQFEQMLNDKYGVDTTGTGWNNRSGSKVRAYGTYLRSADREMFNINYQEYLKTGRY